MVEKELQAFDKLPKQLRTVLNYTYMCVDPRYILGMYRTQGLRNTMFYLDSIGLLDGKHMIEEEPSDNNKSK